MSRAGLRDLSEGEVLSGVDLTRAEAVALSATRLVTATPEGDGWRVAAGQWVGAVRCGTLEVRVAPKVGPVKVLALLARAHGVTGLKLDAEQLGLADNAPLSTLLAVLFEREAITALRGQPQRGYRTEEQSLPVVRGRIRLVDQALRRFGAVAPIEVTVDDWTLDTDDNRRLRVAAGRLLGLPDLPVGTRAGLRRVERLLAEVPLPVAGALLASWRPTRLNAHLHRLLHLADLAIAGASVEHRTGSVVARGFALNMAWVFERLLEQLLRERCRATGSACLRAQDRHLLDEGKALVIKPDLVIADGSSVLAVADTKYKLLAEDGSFPNADAYQLITYCLRLGLAVGHLIYAGTALDHPDSYVIRGAGVTLLVHAIDLQVDLAGVEEQVGRLHDQFLRPARSSSAVDPAAGAAALAGSA